MTLEEYNIAMLRIHNELMNISNRTEGQAWLGIADTSNPMFVELMQRHEHLIKVSSELIERMAVQLQKID